MRLNAPSLRPLLAFAGLTLLVITSEVMVVQSVAFTRRPDWVSLGVTADLVVGIPILFYFLIIRRFKLSIRSLLSVFGMALLGTALILPANQQQVVGLLRRSLMLIELGGLGYVVVRLYRVIARYRQLSLTTVDFITNLTQSLNLMLGHSSFNRILVSELAVLRYGLFGWMAPVEKSAVDTIFTTHKNSGQIALTLGLLSIGLIETVVVHIPLSRWSPVMAWVLTGVGLYGLLFFVADLVATIKRPVLVSKDQVSLRFGLRGYGTVNRQQIDTIISINDKPARHTQTLAGTLLTTPNLLITLREPVIFTGLLGRQKAISRIALFIDERDLFIHQLMP